MLQSLPLLRGIALGSPCVDSGNLSLKHRVDKTVARKHSLALELGRNDHSLERLATTTYRDKPLANADIDCGANLPERSSISTW